MSCALPSSSTNLEGRCDALSARYQVIGALALGAGALAGSGALTTSIPEDQTTRIGVAVASASLTAAAVALVFVRDDVLDQWASTCETATISE